MFSFFNMLKSSDKEDKPSASVATLPLPQADAQYVAEKLKELYKQIHYIQEQRDNSEVNLAGVNKVHEKMLQDPNKTQTKAKLKQAYKTALQDCQTEADSIRDALAIIQEIRATLKSRPRKTGLYNHKETSIRRGALMKMVSRFMTSATS